MLFKGSRYATVPVETMVDALGRSVRYLRARLIPPTPAQAGHTVIGGERLDHIAFRHFRDPERFWRICDANVALQPDELVAKPGRVLRIPSTEE